jgi:hypothetical protein
MVTTEQVQANRNNARRSTGPRTAEGKARSSQNALKHGLRAQATVLPGENIDDFHFLVAELENQFQPQSAVEWTLLRQLADAEWRMRRVPQIEAGVFAENLHDARRHYEAHPNQLPGDPEQAELYMIGAMAGGDAARSDTLSKLSRYEARLSHRYFKALEHLEQLQRRRKSQTPPPGPAEAATETGQTNPIPPSGASSSACSVEPRLDASPASIQNPPQSAKRTHSAKPKPCNQPIPAHPKRAKRTHLGVRRCQAMQVTQDVRILDGIWWSKNSARCRYGDVKPSPSFPS